MSRPPARVFIVDDHPLIREWLATLIEREPDLRACGRAADGNAALAALARSNADIVVVDLSLNRGSGLELITELQARFPAIHVLVLTMHEETAWAERAFRAGARGYVLKRESGSRVVAAYCSRMKKSSGPPMRMRCSDWPFGSTRLARPAPRRRRRPRIAIHGRHQLH